MKYEKSIIKLIILILALSAGAAATVLYAKKKIRSEAEKIHEKRSMLFALENQEKTFLQLESDYEILKRELPVIKKSLPEEEEIYSAVGALENIAVRTGNVGSLEFEPLVSAQTVDGVKSVKFSANLIGSSATFIDYLKEIESFPYFVEISEISIKNDLGFLNSNSRLVLNAKLYIKL